MLLLPCCGAVVPCCSAAAQLLEGKLVKPKPDAAKAAQQKDSSAKGGA